jgi:CheY-like chemotaxis protein
MKKLILVVDDEAELAELIGLRLEAEGRFEVKLAHSVHAALQVLEKHDVDFVLTDIRMPKEDGISLARKIRERFPAVPFAFLTGYADLEPEHTAVVGSAKVFPKPIDYDVLIAAIDREIATLA